MKTMLTTPEAESLLRRSFSGEQLDRALAALDYQNDIATELHPEGLRPVWDVAQVLEMAEE